MKAEYLKRAEIILAEVRCLNERTRRDECLDKLAQGNKKPLSVFCGYLASIFILRYADLYKDQNINIITLHDVTDPKQFHYYVAIGSVQAPSNIIHKKSRYLPYEDVQTESDYTLSDLSRDNAELVLVDVYHDRCFPQPLFESSNWKVSDDAFVTRVTQGFGGNFIQRSREPNVLSLKASFPVTRIEDYSNSDLIEAARGIIHDPKPGPFLTSDRNENYVSGLLSTFFGRGAPDRDQSANADTTQRGWCRVQ